MSKTFHIDIVSPKGALYQAEAVSLVVPATLGYLGVLANHMPLVALLKKGRIIIRDAVNNTVNFICEDKGFMEVLNNKVTIILN